MHSKYKSKKDVSEHNKKGEESDGLPLKGDKQPEKAWRIPELCDLQELGNTFELLEKGKRKIRKSLFQERDAGENSLE